LGEISPIGRLFTLVTFLKIKKSGPKFWAIFFYEISCVSILAEIDLGYILGEFVCGQSFVAEAYGCHCAVLPRPTLLKHCAHQTFVSGVKSKVTLMYV
jgi:hypothetical protein